jgi:pimeloyl-ACP methyl ester carboxylesterase
VEPIVVTDQGHFFTGMRTHTGPAGTSVYGTHVEYQTPRSVRNNLVLVHGGGGQALDMLTTADGRPGWATLFLRDGFAVYTVDRPGLGRSPYHPDIYGAQGPAAAYEGFGPSVLLTHSLGGGFGWLALSECPSLVKAVVAVEPAGPPFATLPGLGSFAHGLTPVPLVFGPGPGEGKLGRVPIAVVTAESSGHEAADRATASFLRSCGADVDELRLGELGLHGNAHAMMLERNNAEIAALITDWIVKHT